MQRVLGLLVVLVLAVGAGMIYWQSREWDSQKVPQAYKVLDSLETKGLYGQADIEFEGLNGEPYRLSQFKGKIVILSFWATWCEPCVEEFPSFVKLMDEFPDDIVVIAISQDSGSEEVVDFVDAFKGQRDNLILTMDEEKRLSRAFAVDRLPEGFIFDRNGILQKKIIGIQDWASPPAIQYFKELLK